VCPGKMYGQCSVGRTRARKQTMKKACSLWLQAFHLVRLAGIEPTTPWFVAKYSIQLSYSREDTQYSMKNRAPSNSPA